ncbi:hypothetical protein OQA88_10958 [Cercophora sp. LCS_1]
MASSGKSMYRYKPLRERHFIRLLVLDPAASADAPLTCRIIQCPRAAEFPAYSAISYVWGKQDFPAVLEIWSNRDADGSSYLSITQNVDMVLRRFRFRGVEQYLRIDAVCLNQHDDLEKAQPIPIMGSICEQAEGGLEITCTWWPAYQKRMLPALTEPMDNPSILKPLWDFHCAERADPRDRIAAFLGLTPIDKRFEVDYNTSWASLYRHNAQFVFKSGEEIEKLQLLQHLFEFGAVEVIDNPSHPSWVPNWSKFRQRTLPYLSISERDSRVSDLIQRIGTFLSGSDVDYDSTPMHTEWNEYLDKLRKLISTASGRKPSMNYSHAEAILEKFCLFALEPYGEDGATPHCPRYGVGPRDTKVGDIVIPIWIPDWNIGSDTGPVTMLVVRPVPGGEVVAAGLRGKVIGPALSAFKTPDDFVGGEEPEYEEDGANSFQVWRAVVPMTGQENWIELVIMINEFVLDLQNIANSLILLSFTSKRLKVLRRYIVESVGGGHFALRVSCSVAGWSARSAETKMLKVK